MRKKKKFNLFPMFFDSFGDQRERVTKRGGGVTQSSRSNFFFGNLSEQRGRVKNKKTRS